MTPGVLVARARLPANAETPFDPRPPALVREPPHLNRCPPTVSYDTRTRGRVTRARGYARIRAFPRPRAIPAKAPRRAFAGLSCDGVCARFRRGARDSMFAVQTRFCSGGVWESGRAFCCSVCSATARRAGRIAFPRTCEVSRAPVESYSGPSRLALADRCGKGIYGIGWLIGCSEIVGDT